MGYYRQFIPKFKQIAWPLYELMSGENAGKKEVAITWDDKCQWSFDDLKCLCPTLPVLTYANLTRPFKLHTDACRSSFGGLSSTRLLIMVLVPLSPTLVGVWQRVNPTTPPTYLSFTPSSGPWSRNSTNTSMDWPLISTQTIIPWPMF